MNLLLDSGVWWRRYHGLPLPGGMLELINAPTAVLHLCPFSVSEMLYKWRHKRHLLPGPDPALWLEHSLTGFRLAPVGWEAARLAGLWEWTHGDPVDRVLCAVARLEGLTLIHTDKVLRDLAGFPQQYFAAAA